MSISRDMVDRKNKQDPPGSRPASRPASPGRASSSSGNQEVIAVINASTAALQAKIDANSLELKTSFTALERKVDERIEAVNGKVTEVKEQVEAVQVTQEKQGATITRVLKRLDRVENLLMSTRLCNVRFSIKRNEAATPAEAIQKVNAELTEKGFAALKGTRAFAGKRKADNTEVWIVLGRTGGDEVSFAMINQSWDLKASGTIVAVGYDQTPADREEEDALKASPRYQEVLQQHLANGGKKPFYLYGRAKLNKDWWSLDKLAALGDANTNA